MPVEVLEDGVDEGAGFVATQGEGVVGGELLQGLVGVGVGGGVADGVLLVGGKVVGLQGVDLFFAGGGLLDVVEGVLDEDGGAFAYPCADFLWGLGGELVLA